MRNYRDLVVWQRAHKLTLQLYGVTARFPKSETYALTSQIRRSAASIGANLAEGCGRWTDGELNRFTLIAMGSASELDYHLLLASELNFLSDIDYKELSGDLTEIRRMLTSLKVRLKASS
jgi:four helix bundle protein